MNTSCSSYNFKVAMENWTRNSLILRGLPGPKYKKFIDYHALLVFLKEVRSWEAE